MGVSDDDTKALFAEEQYADDAEDVGYSKDVGDVEDERKASAMTLVEKVISKTYTYIHILWWHWQRQIFQSISIPYE